MRRTLIIFLLLIPFALTEPSFNLQHSEIQPGETIFATITTPGEFTKEIDESAISFYEGRKEIFFEHGLKFYNNTYYFYAYTTRQGNFTIKIDNVLYKEGENLKSSDMEIPVEVKENPLFDKETNTTYTEILSIKPGLVFSSAEPRLKLTNKGTRQLNFSFNDEEPSINPLMSEEITFLPEQEFTLFEISSYKKFTVPVIYLGLEGPLNKTEEKTDLRAEPDFLTLNLVAGEKSKENLTLFNFGDDNLTEIKISSDIDEVKISKLEKLGPREIQNLTLEFSPKEKGYLSGSILIKFMQNHSDLNITIPLSLYILPKGSEVSETDSFTLSEQTCDKLSGKVCASGEICSGDATFTKGGDYCCLETCEPKPEEDSDGSYGWIIGIVLLLIVVGGGYYLYKKSKKLPTKKPEDHLEESSKNYLNRLSGKTNRIQGGVQRS